MTDNDRRKGKPHTNFNNTTKIITSSDETCTESRYVKIEIFFVNKLIMIGKKLKKDKHESNFC